MRTLTLIIVLIFAGMAGIISLGARDEATRIERSDSTQEERLKVKISGITYNLKIVEYQGRKFAILGRPNGCALLELKD